MFRHTCNYSTSRINTEEVLDKSLEQSTSCNQTNSFDENRYLHYLSNNISKKKQQKYSLKVPVNISTMKPQKVSSEFSVNFKPAFIAPASTSSFPITTTTTKPIFGSALPAQTGSFSANSKPATSATVVNVFSGNSNSETPPNFAFPAEECTGKCGRSPGTAVPCKVCKIISNAKSTSKGSEVQKKSREMWEVVQGLKEVIKVKDDLLKTKDELICELRKNILHLEEKLSRAQQKPIEE